MKRISVLTFSTAILLVKTLSADASKETTVAGGASSSAPPSTEASSSKEPSSADEMSAAMRSEMPGNQRITWERRRQVPFVRDGGVLNRKETALVFYLDGDLFPPALMASIQRGIYYWLTLGLDVGGDQGTFQALMRIKQEMSRTRKTNFFFWGWHIRTGYKYVDIDYRDSLGEGTDMRFDDNSWILAFQNTFSFRFGLHRRRSIFITTELYWDFDLRGKGIQPDFYVFPATVGFETVIAAQWNFFIEGGVILSINGWELSDGTVMSKDGDVFPTASMGFAYRFGGVRTALPENWRNPSAPPMR
jgi:hypothetical protein